MEELLRKIMAKFEALETRVNSIEAIIAIKTNNKPIEKHLQSVKQGGEKRYQPYFDINAMMDYCYSTGIHPADLTSEEMDRFRFREKSTNPLPQR